MKMLLDILPNAQPGEAVILRVLRNDKFRVIRLTRPKEDK